MERAIAMTGIGGQGIQLVAKLLAEAGIHEGRQVMMFGIFMGMIRGGSSESTVVLADDEIVSPPIVPELWGVLAMHPEGLPKLAPKVGPGGLLVRNATMVVQPPAWDGVLDVAVPATDLAKEMGQPLGASMIGLGALAAASRVVELGSLVEALATVLPPHRQKHITANRACLERGAAWVAERGTPSDVAAWH
ncbi:MAG TPA: 2-oxoacid:acceptor oxidoreductase family protein [Candidatus Binatia bacterium]|nr:2-oxoacid:acceptor oxidoreductase family protein [Candidatus Binatia bacterium]